MKLQQSSDYLTIEASAYILKLTPMPQNSFIRDKQSGRLFAFVAGGDCDVPGSSDEAISVGQWDIAEQNDTAIILKNAVVSKCWEKRVFCIRAEENRLEFWHELTGHGALQEIRFFRACFANNEYGFCGDINEVYDVAPNFHEQNFYHPTQTVIHNYGEDFSLTAGGLALASVPHVFALHDRVDKQYTVFGAFATPGNYDWDDFIWNPAYKHNPTPYIGDAVLGGGFAMTYYGKKEISGTWTSPKLCVTFAEGSENVLATALEDAYVQGYLPRPAQHKQYPDWWKAPIFCTWHEQVALADGMRVDFNAPGDTPVGMFCTQKYTDHWLDVLAKHDCMPGTVILDDKWQCHLATAEPDKAKWPDMRKWIDDCHAKGLRVFLWCLAWYKEGIPEDEMITRDGVPICGDITNPKFEARTREMVRRMFTDAPDGLNADGVKIDGLLGLPTGPGLKNHGNIWGLELQKRFLEVFHSEAKAAKKDVCISVFTANPYLDEYSDMIRLGDMFSSRITPRESMKIRAQVIRTTHPGTLIDTDGQFYYSADPDYMPLLDSQVELGIPTLYAAEVLRYGRFYMNPTLTKFTESDYKHIAKVFAEYRRANHI